MPPKLKRSPGTWVEGDRFWNREEEVKLFIEYLRQGTHLRLVAQRRIGKTSLMREAADAWVMSCGVFTLTCKSPILLRMRSSKSA